MKVRRVSADSGFKAHSTLK